MKPIKYLVVIALAGATSAFGWLDAFIAGMESVKLPETPKGVGSE